MKDNQKGIINLLSAVQTQCRDESPREIIIVDNSTNPLSIPQPYLDQHPPTRITTSRKRGPASARNIDWRLAQTKWILFTDSDCIPCELPPYK